MKNLIIAMLVISVLALASVAAVPQFGAQISTSTDGSQVTINGTVIDATEGTNVQLFCNENMIGEFPVIDGAFTATGCNAGTAVLKLGDVETSVSIPSTFAIMPTGGKSKDTPETPFYSFGTQESNAQVPEFSILTLGIAVIGVGLGLAFLRKH